MYERERERANDMDREIKANKAVCVYGLATNKMCILSCVFVSTLHI